MTRALLQQALDALKDSYFSDEHRNYELQAKAIAALREALNAPELEPVAEVFDTFGNSQDPNKAVGHVWLKAHYFPPKGAKLYAVPPAAPAPDGWVMVPRGLLRRLIAEALTFDPSLQDKEAIEQAKQLAASPAAPAAPVVREPQPEPVQRLMRFAGKKRSEVSNPCLTAREAIVIADWMQAHGITGASK